MKKVVLSACLIAGTSVGAGMIALPMTLCKIGIIPTFLLILSVWFFMYISGLLGIELNLRAGRGLSLGKLAQYYSSPIASMIGTISLIVLIYALLCAYLYGGASVLQNFLATHVGWSIELKVIVFIYALSLAFLLVFPVGSILQVNRLLFTILLFFFGFLACGLLHKVDLSNMPHLEASSLNPRSWTEAIPVLFTSYGFHVIFHTLTNFCDKNPEILKRSIFWGSIIPAVVYILWTVSTLSILYQEAPSEYQQLRAGKLEVGQFIQALAQTASWAFIQILAILISILAIIKSSIGVGLGLFEAWQEQWKVKKSQAHSIGCALLTVLPPLMVALFIPQLFLKALSFAGMVLVVIALLLPLWLIHQPKARQAKAFYPIVDHKGLQWLCLVFGILVIICEIANILIGRGS